MTTRIINRIVLTKEVPYVYYVELESNGRTTNGEYPGDNSVLVPPAIAFEDAIAAMNQAFVEEDIAFSDPDRKWAVEHITFTYKDGDFDQFGYKAKLLGFKDKALKIPATPEEKNPDQVSAKLSAALLVLREQALLYTKGVSAQMSILAIEPGLPENDEDEEEAA